HDRLQPLRRRVCAGRCPAGHRHGCGVRPTRRPAAAPDVPVHGRPAQPDRMNTMKTPSARSQRGASLFVALVMMIAITLIGIAGANLSTSEERMARNARDSNIALQAAEAALRDAETDIVATRALSGATLFSATCDQT